MKEEKKMRDLLEMESCQICPRECHVNRNLGETGFCHMTKDLVVARAALHHWEEPCLSGTRGSGTVFFSGCAMGCVFCQNHTIAQGERGRTVSIERLSEIFLELQDKGAHNINLVTPSHYVPQIKIALELALDLGLKIPVVFNSSGYEKVETLKSLEGLVQIYLPDFKYLEDTLALRYSNCKDYAIWAKPAIEEMVRQTGEPVFDEQGILLKGTIVRHLSLPGALSDSKDILEYLSEKYGDKIYISIMNQYTPMDTLIGFEEIQRKVTKEEYDELMMYARFLKIRKAYIQEGESQSESFIPAFDEAGL